MDSVLEGINLIKNDRTNKGELEAKMRLLKKFLHDMKKLFFY